MSARKTVMLTETGEVAALAINGLLTELDALRAERDALQAKVDVIDALHQPSQSFRPFCVSCDRPWRCRTHRIIHPEGDTPT